MGASVTSECRCWTPPFRATDFDAEVVGVDATNLRFGEVAVDTCKHCGSKWLTYFVEYEGFTASGRYFRGLVSPEALQGLTPERAVAVLQGLDWHFRGGSYFRTQGERASGPMRVDL